MTLELKLPSSEELNIRIEFQSGSHVLIKFESWPGRTIGSIGQAAGHFSRSSSEAVANWFFPTP